MSTSWTDPRHNGRGTWRHTPPHAGSVTDLLVALVACTLGALLMLGLLVAGRHVMCKAHAHDETPISYCEPTR